ncbi:formate dehydrogenase accessory sulfurtransferase FdhD [Campylobacter sp. RM9344]|uniref:Sulfur carrier protein FdhD n=1 Tax=Campylobacter californiensis TaxID=1032243 RepID=A0AAW3ZTL6_9BACT|nr:MULTISPECIES: formate dehydrogenase accessory sulfurtransferase FdhD [unclassified Campylobacter]MBE2984123.1 formate dehydrogenase accessory sulfurtransferase FdhD [Campylobacter sp. RM6883]MBE2986253.1 formate dehydrogenase accessory sulfurtransferase FdhD [Campylobacter sp. RM12919]MBE2988250.1 formate dehydrogenase accessory sulfurtransferase FdhD [Campylobacter sp. RM12920]MBE2995785.1 formate dehydrogenase accessory sulfurtransferase FdhD [Campylobacter sp. RM6913]MBE3030169.1 formate
MQPIFTTKITKFKSNDSFECDDILVREIKLDINVNGAKAGSMMATPTDVEALGIGYLLSENIIKSYSDIEHIDFNEAELALNITARIDEGSLNILTTENVIISGCGRSVTASVNPANMKAKVIQNDIKFKRSEISKQMGEFYTQCDLYEKTGCVHTAKLMIGDKFYIGEDIAQHNTIDKAIGKAVMDGANLRDGILMVSGRLSSEMVVKAVTNSIAVLVSRTAPTSLGVLIARRFNLTLCGFVRGENLNVYSGAERVYA